MQARFVVLGVCLAAAAGGWIASTQIAPETTPAIDPARAADLVTTGVRAEWAAVAARAQTLAQLPRLGTAVATDAATVHDLTDDELSFRVRDQETIEIGQVRGGTATSLLRLPPGNAPLPLAPGQRITVDGAQLVFTDTERVDSRVDADSVSGALAVSWRVEPGVVFAQLASMGGATLRIGTGRALAIGKPATDGASLTFALPPVAGIAAASTLTVAATETMATSALALRCLAIVLAGLGATALIWWRPRRAARPIARASTGTPAPVTTSVPRRGRPITVAPNGTVMGFDAHPALTTANPVGPGDSLAGQTLPHLAVGSARFGRYEPLSLLGRGGTSSVFLARATGEAGFERRVALKVLRPELAREVQMRASFLDEARLASRIDHPNVVQIFDLGRAGDDYYIAMEHVDGDDLESILYYLREDERLVPMDIGLAILRRICDGLEAAHHATDAQGNPLHLVHRDMKPGNVLVSRNGSVKVVDFGIAKAKMQEHQTNQGETKGTLQFMAPETRMGHVVDARTDVFGVAAIAIELITGRELNMDLKQMIARGLGGWPHIPPLADSRPDVPPTLEGILWRALAYDPAERYPSCAALEVVLGSVMDDHGWYVSDRELGAWAREELARRTAA